MSCRHLCLAKMSSRPVPGATLACAPPLVHAASQEVEQAAAPLGSTRRAAEMSDPPTMRPLEPQAAVPALQFLESIDRPIADRTGMARHRMVT